MALLAVRDRMSEDGQPIIPSFYDGGMRDDDPTLDPATDRGRHAPRHAHPRRAAAAAAGPRLLVVVGIVLAALNLRPAITSLGALLEEVRDGLGMSGTVAGPAHLRARRCASPSSASTAPRLARRFGPGAVVCAGMVADHRGPAACARSPAARPSSWPPARSRSAGIAVGNVLMPVDRQALVPRPGRLHDRPLLDGPRRSAPPLAAAVTVPMTDALRRRAGGLGLGVWAASPPSPCCPGSPWSGDRGHAPDGPRRRVRRSGPARRARSRRPAADHPQPHRLGAGRLLRAPGHRRLHHHGLDAADLPRRRGLRLHGRCCCWPSPW